MYMLVEFVDHKELAIIPDNWLDGTKCGLWPPYKSTSRITRAVIQMEPPTGSWKAYPIREMYRNESYDKVRSKLKRAEEDSDLQTDIETSDGRPVRRKRSPIRYSSDSENDEPVRSRPMKTALEQSLPTPPTRIPTPDREQTSIVPEPQEQPVPLTNRRSSLPTPDIRLGTNSGPTATPTPNQTSNLPKPHRLFSTNSGPTATPNSRTSSWPTLDRQIGTNSARDVRIYTLLEQLKEEQQNHTTLLKSILARLGEGGEIDPMPEDISFPISTEVEMGSFHDRMSDSNVQKAVVSHLASVGGTSIGNMAERILKYVMTNSLAVQYNWTGANTKFCFKSLVLPVLLKRAIRITFRQATSADVEKSVRSFLKSAKDRDGGRQRRRDKNNPATTPAASSCFQPLQ